MESQGNESRLDLIRKRHEAIQDGIRQLKQDVIRELDAEDEMSDDEGEAGSAGGSRYA